MERPQARGFGQVDMIHNGGTRESSDRLALLRPSKCPTARTDQYPTGQLVMEPP
uniref:Uncharacterized protein n=1 Tax=Oryza sativa subsp. japonica TaxID=39947 RepID=Q6ZH80_ORYSJ|nr:unknown protein [Oryza sativa Japonica Group]